MSQKDYLQLGRQALFHEGDETQFHDALERMGLADPQGVKEHLYHRLLLAALEATTSP